MARWKLSRITYGKEEYTFVDGEEVTLGRSISNTISLTSIVVSRNHCVLNVQANKVLITDLKSSNGIYVGLKKIAPNTPYTLEENNVIGIGWTEGAAIANIKDQEKYMFKLTRDRSITSRIKFQSDDEFCDIKAEVAALTESSKLSPRVQSPVLSIKPPVKRRLDTTGTNTVNKAAKKENIELEDDIIRIFSDSDSETVSKPETTIKRPKLETISEDIPTTIKEEPLKTEKEDLEYDAFKVKQEYLVYDDEAIQIDSDSDGDDESVQWLMRLSQSSPGKPFMKVACESNNENEESSYSQMDDFEGNVEEDFIDDLISIPPAPPTNVELQITASKIDNKSEDKMNDDEDYDLVDDLIRLDCPAVAQPSVSGLDNCMNRDVVDGSSENKNLSIGLEPNSLIEPELSDKAKRTQMIEPLNQMPKTRSSISVSESKHKTSKHKRDKKSKKQSPPRRQISNSQKEERKKKLKEIATKEKEHTNLNKDLSNTTKDKVMVNAKVTSSNRGAFLTDVVQGVVKPMKRKESPKKTTKGKETIPNGVPENKIPEPTEDIENKKKSKSEEKRSSKRKEKDVSKESKTKSTDKSQKPSSSSESRVPLKSLKPLSESEESFSGKPFSKVEPMPPKKEKKKVRFSDAPPEVHVFQIEEGNNMKKTSLVKTSLVDIRQTPIFSLEKITLMKILRWNPHWLQEQINNNEPPPILGHNSPPMTIFHSFTNHSQYVQLVGDLLLMEIWECLTQGYMRIRGQTNGIQMRIASLPPVPTNDRCFELFSLSVNVSVPNNEVRSVPRMGEVLLVSFGPESARNQRFFFVHNVRCLPSPPNNRNSFFCISLHACYTDKMRSLKAGELMIGMSLAYIQKELMLFQAMEHLAGSPLSEAILRPESRHFVKNNPDLIGKMPSQWIKTLNASQQTAVLSSVSAALGDRPCIQMVQGPPGTGKSSVICAMVMSYFFDHQGRKQQNRGKILICATSNAAVDELVCRLLNVRQNLPKAERFRMVRVGRPEAMHPRAHDISSQQLAQRDAAARQNAEPTHPGLSEEISHLEAKINMWKTQEQDTKDPTRKAYCNSRVSQLVSRIALLRGGGGGGGGEVMRAEQLVAAERRIIEGADIVVTTLASAHNHKMRGLRRRIALCIVDEAGQAIEPETLIPLTLDVTKLTLIGDPQQLPGFICSQRAKKHGLGESLFSRLTSCAEQWPEGSPVVLLNQQYRMQADIADYPNRAFYGGQILSVPPLRPDIDIPPYSIVGISSGDKGQGASGANEMEAWGVSRVVIALSCVLRPHNLSLAVITPYNAHKELIKKNLRCLQDPSETQIEVNTVDSFQGQERDVVVVSLARSAGVGFLTDTGRMNVMLTRARHALLVCLNPHAMIKNYQWRTLVEDAQRRNLYRVLPNKMCQVAATEQTPPAEVLKYISYQKPLTARNKYK
ncbi:uncharacterized protein LOC126372288 isoform X2 [Pectinophora gossypiella]|uniref:uncharacterized protein LOC126372288 isoform X2 n=1 Tax=Pectinophora gossypiella TaxID=13191 RepID=UPI00214DF34F|nr:uncharacterized protein LOC126372288 isoform X2 [Pectinophora gossypiella]